jgi:hypothetical protein
VGWRARARARAWARARARRPEDPDPTVDADRPVRTYLWQALVATLLCCLPTGAVALVYASLAQNRLQTGDLAGARHASDRARRWCLVSIVTFVAVLLLYLVAVVIIVAVAQHRR